MLLMVNAGSIRRAMRLWPRQGLVMCSRGLLGLCSVRVSTPCRLPSVVSICMVWRGIACEIGLVHRGSLLQMYLKSSPILCILCGQRQGERHAVSSGTTLCDCE